MTDLNTQLKRFLEPKSIAVFGGSWAENVIRQLQKSDYQGAIWAVHPRKIELAGVACFARVEDLPSAPDAAFIGVNRTLTIDLVTALRNAGAGGVICFASGFRESDVSELKRSSTKNSCSSLGGDLQDTLVAAAGEMPLLGPNCYGYLNYLDNIMLWPDQHGGQAVESGVAIIAQSSNVAINMTMQKRGLSIAYMFTVGNQACVGLNDLAEYAINDSRVSTVGLFIEGFGKLSDFESMASKAKEAGKTIVALKLGKSTQAQRATMTHTATLAGSSAAASAFLKRLGIVEVESLASFIETLKLLDVVGPLAGPRLSSVSCSGGEASLIADAAHGSLLEFPDLSTQQQGELFSLLGDKVSLANPLDYHTYVWGDVATMTLCFSSVMRGEFDLNVFVLDVPRSDYCETAGHRCAIDAIIHAKRQTQSAVAVVSSLSENMDEQITKEFHQAGIVVLHGLETGVQAIVAAVTAREFLSHVLPAEPVYILPAPAAMHDLSKSISEADAKTELARYGVPVPKSRVLGAKAELDNLASKDLQFPLVLKGLGLEHKSELGAVMLDIKDMAGLANAIKLMPDCDNGYMLEQMIDGSIAEIIVGVTRDDTGLLMLTVGAGGVLTELLTDSVSLLIPVSQEDINCALNDLKINALLNGYRGAAAVNRTALLNSILAIQAYALEHAEQMYELDVNPLIVREHDCYAVDALIRLI